MIGALRYDQSIVATFVKFVILKEIALKILVLFTFNTGNNAPGKQVEHVEKNKK